MTNCERYVRAGQIAQEFGLSERTVRRWIASGEIRSTKVGGARLIARVDLDELFPQPKSCPSQNNAQHENEEKPDDQWIIGTIAAE